MNCGAVPGIINHYSLCRRSTNRLLCPRIAGSDIEFQQKKNATTYRYETLPQRVETLHVGSSDSTLVNHELHLEVVICQVMAGKSPIEGIPQPTKP